MKTLLSIALVGTVAMVAVLELGIQRGLKYQELRALPATEELQDAPMALAPLPAQTRTVPPPSYLFTSPVHPGAAGIRAEPRTHFGQLSDLLPNILPKGAPRFSRIGECARRTAGTGPLKTAGAMAGQ